MNCDCPRATGIIHYEDCPLHEKHKCGVCEAEAHEFLLGFKAAVKRWKQMLKANQIGATTESFPLFRCPHCNESGIIDQEQFEGKVSILCECGYHETKNWKEEPLCVVM